MLELVENFRMDENLAIFASRIVASVFEEASEEVQFDSLFVPWLMKTRRWLAKLEHKLEWPKVTKKILQQYYERHSGSAGETSSASLQI